MKNDSFKEYVLEQLREAPDVSARPMFGSHGLYCGDVFFGIISKGRFYLKTDASNREDFVRRGMKPFRPNAKQLIRNYYEVPPDILESAAQLSTWARRSVGCSPASITPRRGTR